MKNSYWNDEWKRVREKTGHGDNVDFWNDFAPRFRKKPEPGKEDPYVEQFYALAGLKPEDTVFDMGCGSGTLAIPFAEKGNEVFAADFSPKMLEVMMEDVKELNLNDRIHPLHLDWNADWSDMDLPVCDVAISSRSLMTNNPQKAVEKLEMRASRSVCLGLWTHGEYDYDYVIADAIGYEGKNPGVFEYVLNMLLEMHRMPTLSYIKSPFRPRKYESPEKCIEEVTAGFPEELTEEQKNKLNQYVGSHLVEYSDDKGKGLIFDHTGTATWAFIKWDIKK